MLLHRYFGSHAIETLRDNLLKAATVSSLNDPFEFLYQLSGQMTMAKAKRHLKQRRKTEGFFEVYRRRFPQIRTKKDLKIFIAENKEMLAKKYVEHYPMMDAERLVNRELLADRMLRIVCFSEAGVDRLDEILMWSHYANKHKGVRIGFEFPASMTFPFKVIPMRYSKERVALDLTNGIDMPNVKLSLEASIRVKSLAWEYEREHRLIAASQFCICKQLENGESTHFVKFNREWVKNVDLGVRVSEPEVQVMKRFLETEYPKVCLRQAFFHRTDYALEYRSV